MSGKNKNNTTDAVKFVETEEFTNEVANQLSVLENIDDSQIIVYKEPKAGMEFTIKGTQVNTFNGVRNGETTELHSVKISCSNGISLPPAFFSDVDGEVSIGTTKNDIATFVAYHKLKKTPFTLSTYKAKVGKYGDDDYRPATGVVEIA